MNYRIAILILFLVLIFCTFFIFNRSKLKKNNLHNKNNYCLTKVSNGSKNVADSNKTIKNNLTSQTSEISHDTSNGGINIFMLLIWAGLAFIYFKQMTKRAEHEYGKVLEFCFTSYCNATRFLVSFIIFLIPFLIALINLVLK